MEQIDKNKITTATTKKKKTIAIKYKICSEDVFDVEDHLEINFEHITGKICNKKKFFG